MKTFRGKKVIGWDIVVTIQAKELTDKLNQLMDKYEFIDCQYSTCSKTNQAGRNFTQYSAIVLLGEKDEKN